MKAHASPVYVKSRACSDEKSPGNNDRDDELASAQYISLGRFPGSQVQGLCTLSGAGNGSLHQHSDTSLGKEKACSKNKEQAASGQ
jgi:hypothetical protein